jgi:hypothetical protein
MFRIFLTTLLLTCFFTSSAQIIINEGSNKNYSTIPDEDGEFEDWIELYNANAFSVDLFNYSLTDNAANPTQWTFPHITILPGQHMVIFCSGKNRFQSAPFTNTVSSTSFLPTSGWNTHTFTTPFNWDGVSNVVINVCSYSSTGYTINSTFNQSATPFRSTIGAWQDGSSAACGSITGTSYFQRPNIRLNGLTIGTGTIQNPNTDYPAPYGNWYWGSRTQMLIRASELTTAGLTAGNINSIGLDVVTPDPCTYDYVDFSMNATADTAFSSNFLPPSGYFNHTNFKLSSSGETVFLYTPTGTVESSLFVDNFTYDNSIGSLPDGAATTNIFSPPTPGASNNASVTYPGYAIQPDFSIGSGFFTTPTSIGIIDYNSGSSQVYYTLDGSDPTTSSTLFTGPISIFMSTVIKARAFVPGLLPSPIRTGSYFFNVNHITPIISVITQNNNLYGPTGMFDNYNNDWLKAAYVEYFDSTSTHNMIFSMPTGIIMDGGAGGSRSQPQHSFRLEMDNPVLGDGSVTYPFIPDRPERNKYSKFYLRNGSNQYLRLPYKDACQVRMMCKETNCYYSSYRPVSVYINGQYFGLYELREKYDTEMFKQRENATPATTEILSMSYFYGLVLRAVEGSVDNFWNSYNAFTALNTSDTSFWNQADSLFDLTYYSDYIISESWMGNVDWPGNNIKIYRSDKTNYRWRFCTIDLELAMLPNSWTDCNFDHINYMLGQSTSNPYINIWLKSLQNGKFKNYFINRFADVMNTAYDTSRLLAIENDFFNQTVVEMQNEYQRWGNPFDIPGQMIGFNNDHLTFQSELICRNSTVRNHIENGFSLPQQVDLTLDVYPFGAGKIHISTIEPGEYPWQGVYFDGLPVKIEAIATPGYTFSHWEDNGLISDTLNKLFDDTLNISSTIFRAHFDATSIGLNEHENLDGEFEIFPSPAQNSIKVLNKSEVFMTGLLFELSDINGRILMSGNLNNQSKQTDLYVEELNTGLYIVQIKNKGAVIKNLRFIKL